MSNIHNSELSDARQFSHGAPVIWLEFLRPVMFYHSADPSFQPGALHSIDWKSSLELLRHVFNLVRVTCDLKEEDFVVMPAFRYVDATRNVAKPGAGLFANDGIKICDSLSRTVAGVLTTFCMSVLTGQENHVQEQLFPIELPSEIHEKILIFVGEFSAIYGGKKVGEARLLKTSYSENLLTGTYRPAKDSALPPPIKWSVIGEIDGIRGKLRTIYISVEDKKTIPILFNEEVFKEQLRLRVLDELIYEVEIETEWISLDKSVDRLVSFTRFADGLSANKLF